MTDEERGCETCRRFHLRDRDDTVSLCEQPGEIEEDWPECPRDEEGCPEWIPQ
jgi:hypothetical protein